MRHPLFCEYFLPVGPRCCVIRRILQETNFSRTMKSVILSAVRTPIGSFGGALKDAPAPVLGATAIRAAVSRAGLQPEQVQEVIMGNVITAGVGQAPARQAALKAGLPRNVACMTINKVCGSGMKALMLADQGIRAGDFELAVAGGQESMSNAPYLLMKARFGYRLGHDQIIDAMFRDGLEDAYDHLLMGEVADRCAETCQVPREAQDKYAILSYQRAQKAIEEGLFKRETVAVVLKGRKGEEIVVDQDEEPFRTNFDKIPRLRPAFTSQGTVTAANASKINDGAAALVVASEAFAEKHGLKPLARIVAQASYSDEPLNFPLAPIPAIRRVLEKAGMTLKDIDLFEINEAFALVALLASRELHIPVEKLNVHGGAVALGHPIGASGARIVVTLLHALEQRNLKRGLAAICIGGGEATAVIVERI